MNVMYEEHIAKSASYVSDAADKAGAAGVAPPVKQPLPSYKSSK